MRLAKKMSDAWERVALFVDREKEITNLIVEEEGRRRGFDMLKEDKA